MTTTTRGLVEMRASGPHLHFHRGQWAVWNSVKRFVFMIAGTQGGKTSFGPWWLQREIDAHGAGDYLAVTSSFDLFKLKMLPEIQNVFEHLLGIGRYWPGNKVIELFDPETGQFWAQRADDPMWGRIILRSAQAKGGLESSTAKAAWLDEAGQDEFTLEAWEAVRRRLSLNRGRVLGTTTPYNLGWLKQIIYDRWAKGADDIDVIQFDSTFNPSFPVEEFLAVQETMADWRFRMFYRGQFTKPAGMIYDTFQDVYREQGGHLVRPFAIPSHWPRLVGIDPGAVHLAQVWAAYDEENDTWYLYHEQMDGRKSTPEHAADALQRMKEEGSWVKGWYIGSKSELQQRLDWENAKIKPVHEPPVADVEAGIDRVIGLWNTERMFVFDTLSGVRDQLGRYRRVLDEMNEPTDQIQDKETFHFLDALRYLAAGIAHPRKAGVVTSGAGAIYTPRPVRRTIGQNPDRKRRMPR